MRESVLELTKWIIIWCVALPTVYVIGAMLIDAMKAEQKKIADISRKAKSRALCEANRLAIAQSSPKKSGGLYEYLEREKKKLS